MANNTQILENTEGARALPQEPGRVPEADDSGSGEPRKSRLVLLIFLVVVAAAAVGGFFWWKHAGTYESTDDAQVTSHLSNVSARVPGTVTAVHVEENQYVNQGQLIAELDPRDYQNALEQAQSEVAQNQAQVRALNPNVPLTETSTQATVSTGQADVIAAEAAVAAAERDYEAAEAAVREAEATSARAQADVARYEPLVAKDEVPRQQYDQVVATAKAQAAVVESRRASAAAAARLVEQRRAAVTQATVRVNEARETAPLQLALRRADIVSRQAGVRISRTQVERAQLDLSYTKIFAPVSGIVSRRTAEVGQHVNAGQQMVQIAQVSDIWVTANFKETQLRRMGPGQRAEIHVDAFKADFNGTVESLPASTGAVTSLLPPENATGNFVKVVQRLPVRIRFAPNQAGLDRLRPGMSVDTTVFLE